MPVITHRMLTTAATVCLIAASLGAAIEMNDDIPPGDMSFEYQEHNYNIDSDLKPEQPQSKSDDALKTLLLYKILSSFRNQDVSPYLLAGPKWISSGTVMVPPESFDISLSKGPIMKRISEIKGVVPKIRLAKPALQKWKIKKGKVGSQMICYFKLCAFRPPM